MGSTKGIAQHTNSQFINRKLYNMKKENPWMSFAEKTQEQVNYLSPEDKELISDGYHTFKELYEFRKMYNAALFNEWAKITPNYIETQNEYAKTTVMYNSLLDGKNVLYNVHKSWKHYDGELCFGGGWFIVSAMLPTGLISNHYEAKDWEVFKIPEVEKALYEFDSHTGEDVLKRLSDL